MDELKNINSAIEYLRENFNSELYNDYGEISIESYLIDSVRGSRDFASWLRTKYPNAVLTEYGVDPRLLDFWNGRYNIFQHTATFDFDYPRGLF